jgi:hypothetical protein
MIVSLAFLQKWYTGNFEDKLKGRRILYKDIEPLLNELDKSKFIENLLGTSENGIPIHKITIGSGAKRVLIWSQMHGNESTGTKALFDLFKFLQENNEYSKSILQHCTLIFIPLLNPDGALKFTRENANNIDLNRDAVNRKALESRLLRACLEEYNPQFCFNLHDQRSIFNVQGTANPATLSFLAPSINEERALTKGRKETMSVIVAMNKLLQQALPDQIGRYTDEFYPTATGDNFQKLGHNTILFEAGHFKGDYDREKTREFNFYAMVQGLYFIATENNFKNYKPYFDIPKNDKLFLDIIYKNVTYSKNNETTIVDVGIQYKFKVINNQLIKYQSVEKIGDLSNYHSYNHINAENKNFNELKLSNS